MHRATRQKHAPYARQLKKNVAMARKANRTRPVRDSRID